MVACPAWNLAQLTAHVGEELRWLEIIVRTRATSMPDTTAMREVDPEPVRDPAATGAWITGTTAGVVDGSTVRCRVRRRGTRANARPELGDPLGARSPIRERDDQR